MHSPFIRSSMLEIVSIACLVSFTDRAARNRIWCIAADGEPGELLQGNLYFP